MGLLTALVSEQVICLDLQSQDKQTVIEELIDLLIGVGKIPDAHRDQVLSAVLKREELSTTGIGLGVALPHCKHPGIERIVLAIGISEAGVDFDSLDSEPAHIFVITVASPESTSEHLELLAELSKLLRDEAKRRLLQLADTADDVIQLLEEG